MALRTVHCDTNVPISVLDYPQTALHPACQGVLIAESRHCCDLVLPGAALLFHSGFNCTGVWAVGSIRLWQTETVDARAQARSQRLEDIKALQRILKTPTKRHRACLAINLLCRRLGFAVVRSLPAAAIARIVATSPEEIAAARNRYEMSLATLASTGRMSDRNFLNWQRHLYQ